MKTGCLMTGDGSDDDMIKPQAIQFLIFLYFSSLHITA